MKKIVAVILAMIMSFSLLQTAGVFVFAEEPKETYSVTIYKDSTKSEIFLERKNYPAGTRLNIYDCTKEGHTFVSWIDAETGETVEVVDDVLVVPEKNLECYGTWSVNSYKLYYRGFGVTPFEEFDVLYGTPKSEMPVPEEEPQEPGYEFIEWSELPETMPAGNVNIVARWEDIDLQAHFYINPGDTESFESISFSFGEEITAPESKPSKTGYSFMGWSFDGKNVIDDFGIMGESDVSIYAVWKANKYPVTFIAGDGAFADGTKEKTVSVEYDSQIVFNEEPVREHYIFNGWNTVVGTMNNVNGLNFRATWIEEEKAYYTVQIYVMDKNGDYVLASEKKFSGYAGDIVKASYTVEEGFELNKGSNIEGAIKGDDSLVLKVYIDRSIYDFYCDVDGKVSRTSYMYGEEIAVPDTPEKEGYSFLCWEPAVPATMPALDYTVTATWKKFEVSHNLKEVVVEPTCTQDGQRYKACEDCGETVGEITVIPANGHSSSEWIVVVEPTVKTEGRRIKKCIVCGITLSEEAVEKLPNPNKDNYSKAEINIRNNPVTATLNYGETLRVYAVTENLLQGEHVEWSISGEGVNIISSDDSSCEVKSVSGGTAKLTATVVDADGNPVMSASGEKISDSQFINSNAGIIQKIIAFFRNLFGINKVITQSVKVFI